MAKENDPEQRKWIDRKTEVHDTAERHFRENPPPKKIKLEQPTEQVSADKAVEGKKD